MDLEMTGLDPDVDLIIEIATVITDGDLNLLAEGPVLAIHQPESALAVMDEWNQTHHGASGLIDRVRKGVAQTEAEARTLAFIEEYAEPNTAPLCGNTIWQDRRFLCRHMPVLEKHLHYRNIDVSSIKELARRWRPDLKAEPKKAAHTALSDILESVEELRFYREQFFRMAP
jgi:oligoribonuclease